MTRKREFMSDEVWDKILNLYIVPFRHKNCFSPPTFVGHKDSEPLLDKKLPSRLRDLANAAPDMFIDIYSNGVMLPKWRDRGQDFIEFLASIPNRVRYMMSYHPNNHDFSLNDYGPVVPYLKNVLRNKPQNVEFITVSHKSPWVTQEMQDEWRATWQDEINAGLITVHANCSLNPWTGLMEDIATCHFDGCPYSDFGHLFIGVTGNVIACCLDLEEEIVFGNVMKDDPAEMVAKVAAFYANQAKIKSGESPLVHQICANCFGRQRTDLIQIGGVA